MTANDATEATTTEHEQIARQNTAPGTEHLGLTTTEHAPGVPVQTTAPQTGGMLDLSPAPGSVPVLPTAPTITNAPALPSPGL